MKVRNGFQLCANYDSQPLLSTYRMFITIWILFPGFAVAAITASATTGCAHFVFVSSMSRLFETVHAQHTCRIHSTFAATVKRFAHFEYTAAHICYIFFGFDFVEYDLGIVTENELLQHIDDG